MYLVVFALCLGFPHIREVFSSAFLFYLPMLSFIFFVVSATAELTHIHTFGYIYTYIIVAVITLPFNVFRCKSASVAACSLAGSLVNAFRIRYVAAVAIFLVIGS